METVESQPFGQVSYLFWRPGRTDAVVIDPGFDPQSILDLLAREQRRPAAILNTHGHMDHIAGNAAMKAAFPEAPLIIGRNEAHLLGDPEANMSAPFGLPIRSPEADRLVADGDRFEAAGFTFTVREIPGHSPGSVVFICDEFDPPLVFGGDVLFAGSVGRTDLGGDFELLRAGIRGKLFALPEATRVFPGHGPATTVGRERRTNPFVRDGADFVPPS
jgi:glyoxylase-like metal-dependent hydrolase (beta-lactamase superfamily II)